MRQDPRDKGTGCEKHQHSDRDDSHPVVAGVALPTTYCLTLCTGATHLFASLLLGDHGR